MTSFGRYPQLAFRPLREPTGLMGVGLLGKRPDGLTVVPCKGTSPWHGTSQW